MKQLVFFVLCVTSLGVKMGYAHEVCRTEKCIEIANEFNKVMNVSIDPCDDFYGYMCGQWNENYPVSDDDLDLFVDSCSSLNTNLDKQKFDILTNTSIPASSKALKKARELFKSCMDVIKIDKNEASNLLSNLKKFGDWLLLTPEPIYYPKNFWQKYLQKEYQLIGDSPFFQLSIGQHPLYSKYPIIVMQKPRIFLSGTLELNDHNKRGIIGAYKEYIYNVASYLRRKSGKCNVLLGMDKDIDEMIKFELSLVRKEDNNRKMMNIGEFQNWYNGFGGDDSYAHIDWLESIQYLFEKVKIQITKSQRVLFHDLKHFQQLPEILKATKSRTIANYIVWTFIRNNIEFSGKSLKSIRQKFNDKAFEGGIQEYTREITCLMHPNLDKAISLEFVKRYFIESNKHSAQKMIDKILKIYIEDLNKIDWMDEESKEICSEKVQAIEMLVGYPDDLTSATIGDYYKNFKLGANYLESMINLEKFNYLVELIKMTEYVNRTEWKVESTVVDAFYNSRANAITVPAAYLQPPIFDPDMPEVLNYAFFGFTMAHEISHAFDPVGIRCDKEGNVANMLPLHIQKIYEEKAKCFTDQYNKFLIPELSCSKKPVHTNGRKTLAENIPDCIALQKAYDAYKKNQRENGDIDVRLPDFEDTSSDRLFFMFHALMYQHDTKEQTLHT
ncbi:neprilysin-11-like isoform X2 [Prorops nasuta]|uniref:neprilysin-11-like isoform X2 n=1 Tax=Prorops nasuta TaxID=863751 RepID=UPI0034CF3799